MEQKKLEEKISQLRAYQKILWAYDHAIGVMDYDRMTSMPPGGAEHRGESLALLSGEIYKIQTDPKKGELLDALAEAEKDLDLRTRREVQELRKEREKLMRVPKQEVMAQEAAVNRAILCWQKARENNDFASFAPHLAELIDIKRRYAGYVNPDGDVYDTLMDDYEAGMKQANMDPFFASLKEKLVPLIQQVKQAQQPDRACVEGYFSVERQRALSSFVMEIMGLDPQHCVLGESAHPLTTQFSKYDVRITTCYIEDSPLTNLYSVVHEGGHAMYELSIGDELSHSVLGDGASTAIHESQSRLWENNIGRSLPFCQMLLPKMKELFPKQFSDVSDETFYRAVNVAEPSLIRTDADELTYPMHILIRYELEKAIFAGELKVKELPDAWNQLYKKYLGIQVPDDANGVLQDIHWAWGHLGYFLSYALGSAYAAQIYDVLGKAVNVEQCCAARDFAPVRDWLTETIYRHGMTYAPQELMERVCGAPFDPDYYVNYLWDKYGGLYGARK